MKYKLLHGDSEKVLAKMDDNSVDSIVTDPPYGLSFMGKKWDYDVPSVALWRQVFRVLKPGGHLLSFAGSRTYHRMAVNIEDAGFEIRDQIMWIYGSGFPKSMNIAKAIDKRNKYEGDVVGTREVDIGIQSGSLHVGRGSERVIQDVRALSPEAKKWDGWGTALKPAHEPIVVARKPVDGTVVDSVLKHGTGGINIDGCRVGEEKRIYDLKGGENLNLLSRSEGNDSSEAKGCGAYGTGAKQISIGKKSVEGRFPANVIHDGSKEVVDLFPQTKSTKRPPSANADTGNGLTHGKMKGIFTNRGFNDDGSAARFFKVAQFTKQEHKSIVMARKPVDGTVAENVLEHGTGGLNIDGCRVGDFTNTQPSGMNKWNDFRHGAGKYETEATVNVKEGRFPANVIHDGSDEVVSEFPVTKSGSIKEGTNQGFGNADAKVYGKSKGVTNSVLGSEGSASRFFYCAKASKQERNKGFDIELTPNERPPGEAFGETHQYGLTENSTQNNGNNHPTVKPVDLMKYLCRLVTPPNGIVLDPFMGSGTTGIAATVEGFNFIGVEMSEEYLKIADTRISHWVDEKEELIIEERKQRTIFEQW